MRYRLLRSSVCAGILCGLFAAWNANGTFGATHEKPLPQFCEVEHTVRQYFAATPDSQPGDIITRSEVQPLFARLKHLGWTVADQKEILKQIPTEGDFLVRQLRTSRGRRFMRKIGTSPDTYDRLERLSRLPHGKLTVSRLIRQPDKGGDVIDYLATKPKGIKASKQMSRKAGGADFHRPTGRVYTAEMLLNRLKKSYASAQKGATSSGK